MTLEAIGIFTLIVGVLAFFLGPVFAVFALLAFSMLGSAAAFILSSLGGSSIPPGNVILLFTSMELLRHKRIRQDLFLAIAPMTAGFFLLAMGLYSIVSAVFLPRLFEGLTYTFGNREVGKLLPLTPNSGNVTQCVYMIGSCLTFLVLAAYARTKEAAFVVANAVLFAGSVDLFFAVMDYITFATGTSDLILGPIRNANYAMLYDNSYGNVKRLVGSFPEASAYALFTLGIFGFTFHLWMRNYRPYYSGILSFILAMSLMASTSSTAYAGLAAILGLAYLEVLYKFVRGRATHNMSLYIFTAPFVVAFLSVLIQFSSSALLTLTELADDILFNKMNTASGIERGTWNRQAMNNFYDTYGLGAGIGSVRSSSFTTSLLGNIGAVGAVAFVTFVLIMLFSKPDADSEVASVRESAAFGAIAFVIAGSVSGGGVDLGLIFYALAALACARTTSLSTHQQRADATLPSVPDVSNVQIAHL